ncbi:MAG: dihydropteroate synthase [Deltaproteobacteria bacterium]|nr:MAG: dihydropteroate synthase [Deltaproteobacteria bacterium]
MPERPALGRDLGSGGSVECVALVGIVNVTPDSFHDGGRYDSVERAVAHALQLCEEGADLLDVGGESTRPGSSPVPQLEECRRVLPVIEELSKHTETPISVDTRRAAVAQEALKRGASAVNAVAGLRDPDLARVCAEHGALLILNHMRGEPRTMQLAPRYDDVVADVRHELLTQALLAQAAGVERDRIWLDPGLGFGKDPIRHNLPLIARLSELADTGYPVLVGPSRKSFLGKITGASFEDRLPATLAAVAACVLAGASAVRVHDVGSAREAVLVAQAIRRARA